MVTYNFYRAGCRKSSASPLKKSARGPVSRVLSMHLRALGDHSSRPGLATRLKQPTRTVGPKQPCDALTSRAIPIRSCSRWGLPCRCCCQHNAVRSYRTLSLSPGRSRGRPAFCGTFPKQAPLRTPARRTLSGTVALWSPDFPPPYKYKAYKCSGGRPALWQARQIERSCGFFNRLRVAEGEARAKSRDIRHQSCRR